MFSVIRGNFKIERAYTISVEEFGMNPKTMIRQMPGVIASGMLAQLRAIIKTLDLNDREISVLMISPYIGVIEDPARKQSVINKVSVWRYSGLIREEIFENFTGEARKSSDDWVKESLGES